MPNSDHDGNLCSCGKVLNLEGQCEYCQFEGWYLRKSEPGENNGEASDQN
jgi:hypothetical protein